MDPGSPPAPGKTGRRGASHRASETGGSPRQGTMRSIGTGTILRRIVVGGGSNPTELMTQPVRGPMYVDVPVSGSVSR